MPDREQRTSSSAPSASGSAPPSSSSSSRQPPIPLSYGATHSHRPASISTLRQVHPPPSPSASSSGKFSRPHSRRQSVDIDELRPITYFPPPSSFTPSIQSTLAAHLGPSPSLHHPFIDHTTSTMPPGMGDSSGERTPRMVQEPLAISSRSSSPHKPRRGSTLGSTATPMTAQPGSSYTGGMADHRKGSVPRTLSDVPSSSNGLGLGGLGLGQPEARKAFQHHKDDALASPRRISTSRGLGQQPSSSSPYLGASSSALMLPSALTNEAYYSQPPSASTPRFRQPSAPLGQGYGSTTDSGRTHRRNFSINSMASPILKAKSHSPVGSVFRKIRKTASAVGLSLGGGQGSYDAAEDEDWDGDDDMEEEDEAIRSNGMRVWYSSYVTIDWIHDAIKESSRVRKMRINGKRSYRGAIANAWDRFQGWMLVTVIGILSAILAFLIIRTEMTLFDLKEGFCATSWISPKRFCCTARHRFLPPPTFSNLTSPSFLSLPSPFFGTTEEHHLPAEGEECPDWISWGEWIGDESGGVWTGVDFGVAEFGTYALIALILAGLASTLTIYLSSSEHHVTSKDSTFISSPSTPAVTPNGKSRRNGEDQPLLSSNSEGQIHGGKKAPPRKVMYYAAGSGIPEIKTILSGFVIHGYLGGWTLFTKSLGLALSVASGLSLGKEGPLVHIACCCGNIVSRLFTKFEFNEAKRREILSAACAAGVSVAFGAPIGGVLFSLEEVSYYFPPKVMWRSFWCAAVAVITLKALNPFGNGSIVLFAVTYTKPYHNWEFGIFAILGIFGGIYGAIFSRLNILWSRNVRQGTWIGRHPIVEVLFVTGLTTLVSFMNPYCRMGGTELVASLFAECKHDSTSRLCVDHPSEITGIIMLIGTALVIKGCLTIITFGIKLPAGIFIPSLVVGACFGRIAGLTMEWIEHAYPDWPIFDVCRGTECVVPGLYAMVGAAATLAGVTRTTVSLVVIMIELTGSLNYVVPIMLAVLLAKTTADMLEKKGIYDLVIDLNQLPYLDSKHEYLWGSRVVEEVADRSIPTLRADKVHTVRSLTGRMLELARGGMADTGFPVLVRDHDHGHGHGHHGKGLGIGMGGGGKDKERERGGMRVIGFLGTNELEHALALLADEPDARLNLMPSDENRMKNSIHSIFSFADSADVGRTNPYDLSRYLDRAPITVQPHSPLELVQQLFVKLGARQLLVVDGHGLFRGLVTKKGWLNFLAELEAERH